MSVGDNDNNIFKFLMCRNGPRYFQNRFDHMNN